MVTGIDVKGQSIETEDLRMEQPCLLFSKLWLRLMFAGTACGFHPAEADAAPVPTGFQPSPYLAQPRPWKQVRTQAVEWFAEARPYRLRTRGSDVSQIQGKAQTLRDAQASPIDRWRLALGQIQPKAEWGRGSGRSAPKCPSADMICCDDSEAGPCEAPMGFPAVTCNHQYESR
jgi:hypothetical protein